MSEYEVIPKSKKARKLTMQEMTFMAPRPNLGVMAYSKGRTVHGHKSNLPPHLTKAIERRRRTTLTSLIG